MRSGPPEDPALLDTLRGVVGPANVLTAISDTVGYTTDWTRRYTGTCLAVVRPGSTGEVASVVQACAGAGAPIVVQGGNTGLVGGSVPEAGQVLVSTLRLTGIAVDTQAAQATVGAGVTLESLQEAALAHGLRFPVDLAARGSATVGGMVATNAGGLAVLRFGSMRRQIVGIEAVLADGSVISHLAGLVKDNTGYDLASLLCGSEGTLGVVTAIRVALCARDAALTTVAIGVDDAEQAVTALGLLRRGGVVLDAAELVTRKGVVAVSRHVNRDPPAVLQRAFGLVVSVALRDASQDVPRELEDALLAVSSALPGCDIAVAGSGAPAGAMWEWRERHTECIAALGIPVKLDVSVPTRSIGSFLGDLDERVRRCGPGLDTYVFGHLGDANLHVNVLATEAGANDAADERVGRIEETVLRRVAELGGSISAEHGIGRMKARWLHLCRSDAEIAAMRAIKTALDPAGILNPSVLFDRGTGQHGAGQGGAGQGGPPVR